MGKRSKPLFNIPATILSHNSKLNFSFEYYDKTSEKYCISNWSKKQIRNAFLRLQEICTKTFNQLSNERRVYHFGEVDWSKTTQKSGFPDIKVNDLPAYHFALLLSFPKVQPKITRY